MPRGKSSATATEKLCGGDRLGMEARATLRCLERVLGPIDDYTLHPTGTKLHWRGREGWIWLDYVKGYITS